MKKLFVYTREPIDNVLYDPRLAYSCHLALEDANGKFVALNHNSGVLFALATENEDGSLNPKCLKAPYIFKLKNGEYGVMAVRTGAEGEEEAASKGAVVCFKSPDLIRYKELGLLTVGTEIVEKVTCVYNEEEDAYIVRFQDYTNKWFEGKCKDLPDGKSLGEGTLAKGQFQNDSSIALYDVKFIGSESKKLEMDASSIDTIEGAVASQVLKIPEKVADRLMKKLMPPEQVGISFPKKVSAKSEEELSKIYAVAKYSDSTTANKKVEWDLSEVDFTKKGEYSITGKVVQKDFVFPIALNRADPCITKWNGKWYFIATHDADHEHTMYIRESDTMEGLKEAKEHLILDSDTYEDIGGLLWAPEFHVIEGRLYLFHACTPGEFFYEESRIRVLKEGGNPICKEDWSKPEKILRKDGTPLCEEGKVISLDMTCFFHEGDYYVIWSQRQFLPKDLGAWLYIAKLDPKNPRMLLTDPIVLSKPDYGWANNHTFVDEGPFALDRGDKLYITFSAAAVDTSYVVSYLEIEKGKDLLNPANWRKNNYPILTSRSVPGEFGTGHNAYVEDEDGNIWNTYHARPGVDGVRSSGVRRVHFDIDDAPVLDLTAQMDLKEELRNVQTVLVVD